MEQNKVAIENKPQSSTASRRNAAVDGKAEANIPKWIQWKTKERNPLRGTEILPSVVSQSGKAGTRR
jgi:hypothetical protein